MVKNKRLTGIKIDPNLFLEEHFCDDCAENKITRKPIPKFTSRTRSTQPFQFIHTDICGPYGVLSRNGKAYMIVFVDDYSRAIWCYFIRHKSEAINSLKLFIKEVVLPHNILIQNILGGPALQDVSGRSSSKYGTPISNFGTDGTSIGTANGTDLGTRTGNGISTQFGTTTRNAIGTSIGGGKIRSDQGGGLRREPGGIL